MHQIKPQYGHVKHLIQHNINGMKQRVTAINIIATTTNERIDNSDNNIFVIIHLNIYDIIIIIEFIFPL